MVRGNLGFCKHGHEMIGENLYIAPKTGIRGCNTCRRATTRRYPRKHIDGRSKRYRDNYLFGGNREKTIQRDGEKCLKCGMTRVEHKEKFGFDITVNHKDLNGRYKPRHLQNNDIDNLETLCLPCHVSIDSKLRKELAKK